MFIRFVVGHDGQHHRELTGLFAESRLLAESEVLTAEEEVRLGASWQWFGDHLPVPPFGAKRWPRDVVAWFRHDAGVPVSRMWDLAAIFRDHDRPVRMLRSRDPGRIYYEDRQQVVVREWNRL